MATKPDMLLTRDQFREGVFARDGHECVMCKSEGQDAHHIIERRLWGAGQEGGYFLSNGATVCGPCHIRCESTEITVEQIREAAEITVFEIPSHMYSDQVYDKWGNPILPDGRRMRGDLAEDASVQKILATCHPPVVWSDRIKYPRTWHLPWSLGATKDDRIIANTSCFDGKRVVVTVKMDGENTRMYPSGIHARSLDYSPHKSRDWVKSLWSRVCGDIPEGWRLCGENLYARHSIEYLELESYFLLFSIWDGMKCLSWDETTEYAELMGLKMVKVLYDGVWDAEAVRNLKLDLETNEGYVVRLADQFHYRDFNKSIAKFVRKGHAAGSHWKPRDIIQNKMIG